MQVGGVLIAQSFVVWFPFALAQKKVGSVSCRLLFESCEISAKKTTFSRQKVVYMQKKESPLQDRMSFVMFVMNLDDLTTVDGFGLDHGDIAFHCDRRCTQKHTHAND